MATVRLDIAYHGAGFAGWAVQPGKRTIQAELEAALEHLFGEPVGLTVAGRTDAGVHAWGQVASFEAELGPPIEDLAPALNAHTGVDLVVLSAIKADEGFDARRDARSRTYCYRVLSAAMSNPFERQISLFWPYRIEVEALKGCAAALVGSHDFTAFTPSRTKHVRFERDILAAEWREGSPVLGTGELLELWIEAPAFMRSMVRILVGTMLEVSSGRRSQEEFEVLLAGAPREQGGDTAKAHGLHLAQVSY